MTVKNLIMIIASVFNIQYLYYFMIKPHSISLIEIFLIAFLKIYIGFQNYMNTLFLKH